MCNYFNKSGKIVVFFLVVICCQKQHSGNADVFHIQTEKHKKMKKTVLLFLIAALMIGAALPSLAGTVREERKVKAFEGVSISLSADVELRQGAETQVVLEGPAAFLEKVETVVEGGILKIRFLKTFVRWKTPSGRIRIYITTPEIKNLVVTGSADIVARTPVDAGRSWKALVTGSGKIQIDDLSAGSVKMSVTGSGKIRVAGKSVDEEYVVITGSGDVVADDLPAREVKVSITGSGDAYVYAEKYLKVGITGSGDVHYRGPAVIDARITGSGNVRKDD